MDGLVVGHVAHLTGHPCLRLLSRQTLRDVIQHMTAAAAGRDVHHVDAQILFAPHQILRIELPEVFAAVEVDERLAGVLRVAVAVLVALAEMGVRRIEVQAFLLVALGLAILLLAQFAAQALLFQVGQLGADAPCQGVIRVAVESLGSGWLRLGA